MHGLDLDLLFLDVVEPLGGPSRHVMWALRSVVRNDGELHLGVKGSMRLRDEVRSLGAVLRAVWHSSWKA